MNEKNRNGYERLSFVMHVKHKVDNEKRVLNTHA